MDDMLIWLFYEYFFRFRRNEACMEIFCCELGRCGTFKSTNFYESLMTCGTPCCHWCAVMAATPCALLLLLLESALLSVVGHITTVATVHALCIQCTTMSYITKHRHHATSALSYDSILINSR